MPGIWKIRRIHAQQRNCREYVTAITLKKIKDVKLYTRILTFYQLLESFLNDEEQLFADATMFKIVSPNYSITLYLEAYKNSADKLCGMWDGQPVITTLHRMGCECAARALKRTFGTIPCDEMNKLLVDNSMISLYPEPAERYVNCAKLLWRKKKK